MEKNPIEKKIKGLIDNNAIPPYVYTYPPKSTYCKAPPRLTANDIWRINDTVQPGDELNLYIHFPFCAYKCGFCNLYTITSSDKDLYSVYVDAICTDLQKHEEFLSTKNIKTIFLGGGTPTLLSIQDFTKVFNCLDKIKPDWRNTCVEVCIEASPDSIVKNPDLVPELIDLGIDRMNLGIQSLNDNELINMGRNKANQNKVFGSIETIKKFQLKNLSTDLIIGFSDQTDYSFFESLKILVDFEPETISTYFLTLRSESWFSKKDEYQQRNNASIYKRYDKGTEYLLGNGYDYSSHNRFKKANKGGYVQQELQFQGVPVLGIGLGARSYNYYADYVIMNDGRTRNEQFRTFLKDVKHKNIYPYKYIVHTEEELIRRKFVLGLNGFDLIRFENSTSGRYSWIYKETIDACKNLNLIESDSNRIFFTRKGSKYRDIISWNFFSKEVLHLEGSIYSYA